MNFYCFRLIPLKRLCDLQIPLVFKLASSHEEYVGTTIKRLNVDQPATSIIDLSIKYCKFFSIHTGIRHFEPFSIIYSDSFTSIFLSTNEAVTALLTPHHPR